jgi:hypothetical protein
VFIAKVLAFQHHPELTTRAVAAQNANTRRVRDSAAQSQRALLDTNLRAGAAAGYSAGVGE